MGLRFLGGNGLSLGSRLHLPLVMLGGVSAYSISGVVYDADGVTPVADATVALGLLTATSGADGTFTISDIPPAASGSLTCTKTGYSWTAKTIAAMSGNLTAQNFTNRWWAAGGSAGNIVGAYQAIGAASYNASKTNLANPGTYDLVEGTAPAWAVDTGWVGDGATNSRYIKTGILADQATYSIIFRLSGISTSSGYPGGWNITTNMRFAVLADNGVGKVQYRYGNLDPGISPAFSAGTLALSGGYGYRNGVIDTTQATPSSAGREVILLALNSNDTPAGYLVGNLLAAAIYSGPITSILAVHTAMMALTQTSNP